MPLFSFFRISQPPEHTRAASPQIYTAIQPFFLLSCLSTLTTPHGNPLPLKSQPRPTVPQPNQVLPQSGVRGDPEGLPWGFAVHAPVQGGVATTHPQQGGHEHPLELPQEDRGEGEDDGGMSEWMAY